MPQTILNSIGTTTYAELGESAVFDIFQAVSDAVVLVDACGDICFYNEAAENLFGYSFQEVLGAPVALLVPMLESPDYFEAVTSSPGAGVVSVFGSKQKLVGRDNRGNALTLSVSMKPFAGSGPQKYVVIARKLQNDNEQTDTGNSCSSSNDEQVVLRQQLKEMHGVFQSIVLEDVTSSTADVVNQPLAAITTFADASCRMLEFDAIDRERLKQNLSIIAEQAMRAGDAISTMRLQSPSSMYASDSVLVKELISGILGIVKAEISDAGLSLSFDIENDTPAVCANREHIQLVILLLLRATIDASSKADDICQIQIAARVTFLGWIEFSVTLRGVSPPTEDVKKVYYPFTSGEFDKTDLNLSVCNTIVDKHKGRLWRELGSTGTSRFLFTLPVAS